MSTNDPNVPPAGEEIHLPPGSLQPHALTLGITVFLVGLTHSWPLWGAGLVIVVWTLTLWIRDARAEYVGLPVHHHHDDDHADAGHGEAVEHEAVEDAADPAT